MQLKIQLLMLVLMIVLTDVYSKDGFIVSKKNCLYRCSQSDERGFCNAVCLRYDADSGYCRTGKCWCDGLPQKANIAMKNKNYC
uniref:Neurotoxin LmNaTx3 n=1 Tax=Lychas mucronatus TaxID=172552 RepID=SNAA3_LYCMC|nr:RecName: Full=Neurotoxin LmNaTx3; Flags: Precursor [Lychas mucronatus]ABX76751.1 neurotoxin LmNaTx3 precursor [Lychas mucronatus]